MSRPNRLQLAIGAVLLAIGVAPALAAVLPAANSGSISVRVASTGAAASTQPAYASYVGFNTTGTSRLKNPRVWVSCYQNGAMIWGAGGAPTSTFKLGGDSSEWVENGGGPADCTADLYYILNKNGTGEWNGTGAQGGNVYLGHTAFAAAG